MRPAYTSWVDPDPLAWKAGNLAQPNYAFYYGRGNDMGWSDPGLHEYLEAKGIDQTTDPNTDGRAWLTPSGTGRRARGPDLLKGLRLWKGASRESVLIKGVQSARDPLLAKQHGWRGIVVSTSPAANTTSLSASCSCTGVDAMGHSTTILFDSGMRTGADVLRRCGCWRRLF